MKSFDYDEPFPVYLIGRARVNVLRGGGWRYSLRKDQLVSLDRRRIRIVKRKKGVVYRRLHPRNKKKKKKKIDDSRRSHKRRTRRRKSLEGESLFINFRGGEMETTLFLKIRESKKFEVSWLKTPIVSKKRKKKKKIQRNKNSIQFTRYPGKLLRMEKLNWIKSFLKITGSEAKYSIDSTFGPRRSRERESNFNKN